MLAAGKMNRRLTITRPEAGQDAAGQPSSDWEEVATVWASYRAPTGLSAAAESIQGDRRISTVVCSFRIRYRTDIDASMRVTEGSTVYAIKQVIFDVAGRTYVDLVCETGAV